MKNEKTTRDNSGKRKRTRKDKYFGRRRRRNKHLNLEGGVEDE